MRILSIRGRNLASLSDRFEINLDVEPLASAGLFAITGETGTGKSSILDALCLALYGNCPRLSAEGAREAVPDPGGEIHSTDARSCLRRGAAEGFAEVDYVGVDGARYRANWTARRARGRADGTLQNVARTVKRLEDDTVVESTISGVKAAVERTTSLTYDEFRRTVLLAQGDFDALLRADANARADLLERITGTTVYREISKRAFERCADAERAVEQLEIRRAEHRLMPEEDRTARAEEQAALDAEMLVDGARRTEAETMLGRHAAIEAAETNLRLAEPALARAQARTAELAAERGRLSAITTAEPLRGPFMRSADRRTALATAEAAFTSAMTRLGDDEESARQAAAIATAADAGLQAVETRFRELGPVWTRATQLDAEFAAATREVADAERRHADAKNIHGRASADADALRFSSWRSFSLTM
jgi:exonuclease SbcC